MLSSQQKSLLGVSHQDDFSSTLLVEVQCSFFAVTFFRLCYFFALKKFLFYSYQSLLFQCFYSTPINLYSFNVSIPLLSISTLSMFLFYSYYTLLFLCRIVVIGEIIKTSFLFHLDCNALLLRLMDKAIMIFIF